MTEPLLALYLLFMHFFSTNVYPSSISFPSFLFLSCRQQSSDVCCSFSLSLEKVLVVVLLRLCASHFD